MDAKEIIHCALQMEKLSADRSYGNILTLLGDLDKAQVTTEQLETTDIVRALYKVLRTCSDSRVKRRVKSLLSKWKRQFSRGVKATEESREPAVSCMVSSSREAEHRGVCEQQDSHSASAQTSECAVEAAAQEEAPCTEDKDVLQTAAESTSASSDFPSVRVKCVQLLLAALGPEPPDQDVAAHLAGDVEQHIYTLHKLNQIKYKTCVRSKVANLRNPKSGHLRQGLLGGSLSPEAFARMTAEEMASPDLRQLREQYSSRGVSERQLPRGLDGTPTQKIRCKRCGGSDCRVTQVSRGALFLPAWVRRGGPDEDAMTFVTCSGCGQQWYHSGWVCL